MSAPSGIGATRRRFQEIGRQISERRRAHPRRIGRLLRAVGVALSMFLVVAVHEAAAATSAAPLYEAHLTDLSGKPYDPNRLRGKTVVINFWASWCGPCVREMPELATLSDRYARKGVVFVGIAADSAANVKKFLGNVKVDYPIVNAGFEGVELSSTMGNSVRGLPFTVVIGEDGSISYTKLGEISPSELAAQIDEALLAAKRR